MPQSVGQSSPTVQSPTEALHTMTERERLILAMSARLTVISFVSALCCGQSDFMLMTVMVLALSIMYWDNPKDGRWRFWDQVNTLFWFTYCHFRATQCLTGYVKLAYFICLYVAILSYITGYVRSLLRLSCKASQD